MMIRRFALFALAALALTGCGSDPDRQFAEAMEHRRNGEHVAAIILLKNVLQARPDHAEARFLLGKSRLATGEFKAAEAEFRRALQLGWSKDAVYPALGRSLLNQQLYQQLLDEIPADAAETAADPAEANTVRGLAHFALGRFDESRKLLDKALAQSPEYPDALLGLARIAARNRQLDEARSLIDRAVAADPGNLDGWLLKADLHLALKQPKAAEDAYNKLLILYPDNLAARLNLASMRIADDNLPEAFEHVDRALRVAPTNARANFLRAVIAYRQGNSVAALTSITAAHKLAPNDPSVQLLAGTILYARGAYQNAQGPLLRLLQKTPIHIPARKLYAGALLKTGQAGRALEILTPTLEVDPHDPLLLAMVGEAHLRLGNAAEAAKNLAKAVAPASGKRRPNAGYGLVPFVPGDAERSLADVVKALRSNPDHAQPRKLLVLARILAGQHDLAWESAADMERERPNEPDILTVKGTLLSGRKDYAGARAAYEQALARNPDYAQAAVHLAYLDVREGNPRQARERLETLLGKNPKNAETLIGLATLGANFGATDAEMLDWLKRARALRPGEVQVLLLLIGHYLRTNDSEQALATAAEAQKLGAEHPDVLRAIGLAQLTAGQANAAVGPLTRLVNMQPNSPEALRLLAQAHMAADANLAAAGMLLNKALALRPGYLDAMISLAQIQIRTRQLPAALKIIREAQKAGPKAAAPYVLEGDVLMLQGDEAQAARAYEQAYQRARSGNVAIRMHGVLDRLGKGTQAEQVVQTWFDEFPRDMAVRSYYGNYLLQQKRYPEARAEYERVLASQPNNAEVLNNLAWVLDKLQDPRAKQFAARAMELRPDDPAMLDTLAMVLLNQGQVSEAIDLWLRAVTLAPDLAEVRYHLAQAWLKAGNKPKARRELEALIASGKDPARIEDAKQLLKELSR